MMDMDALNILIVEDNALNATDLRETLEKAGHTITAIAPSFELALKAVRRQPPDLVLIDVNLGKDPAGNDAINGIETAKELMARHRVPIIYVTGNTEPKMFQDAKETLPFAYLYKPFRPAELIAQVELAYQYFRAKETNPLVAGPLFLPVDGGHEKIDPKDVLYVEAAGSYAIVFVADNDKYDKPKYVISMNLGNLAQHFSAPNFYRLSRSYLVNLDYVKRLKDDSLHMSDNQTVLQIPVNHRRELLKKLTIVRTK